jgi:hypothetical protein
MSNFTKPTALTFAAFITVMSLGSGAADAATCDGSWARNGRGLERQCYYLPTVSNGRVTGLQLEQNYRQSKPDTHPGVVPHNGYGPAGGYHHGGK